MQVTARSYADGAPSVLTLAAPQPEARWQLHAADEVVVRLPTSGRSLTLAQRPRDLPTARVGVGAVLWDAALVLAAAVDALGASGRLVGETVVELGCGGCPLPSLAAAAAGAAAVATDRAAVLPLASENVAVNDLTPARPYAAAGVTVAPLDWSDRESVARVVSTAPSPTLVLAADCVYADGCDSSTGDTPDVTAFAAAAAAVAGGRARVWIAAEHRSDSVLAAADAALKAAFGSVVRQPVPPAWPSPTAIVWECCGGGGLKRRARGLGLP